MNNLNGQKKSVWYLVIAMFTLLSFQAPAMAGMVSTEKLAMENRVESQRSELKSLLSRDDVAQQLVALGVNAADAQERVDSMTATEISTVYDQMEDLPAGGALGAILAVLLILILLDVAGATDIFPNI